MIANETVFILGAGASKPYGFPTAEELKINICKNFVPELSNFRLTHLRNYGYDVNSIIEEASTFTRSFASCLDNSIDNYININRKFSYYAKKAIIFEILKAEKKFKEKLERFQNFDRDWIKYLYNHLLQNASSENDFDSLLKSINLTFITFNYDSSLEYYLYLSLKNQFTDISDINIMKFFERIQIIHVYGSISDPFQTNHSKYFFGDEPFFGETEDEDVKSILTIYERQEFINCDISTKLAMAKNICFLGFGFALENLQMIKFKANTNQFFYATGLNLTNNEMNKHRRHICKVFEVNSDFVSCKDLDCLELLRQELG